MDYYRLVYSEGKEDNLPDGKNPIVVNSYKLDGFDLRSFWKGKRIENWNGNIELYYEEGDVSLDYIPNNLSWLICSEKVVKVLNNIGADYEFFSVPIYKESNKNENVSANVINVLVVVSVMNWNKSDYISWDDDPKAIKAIRNLVIYRSNIPKDINIFRLAESRNFIIVSEKFKNEIERESLKGFGFWKLDIE